MTTTDLPECDIIMKGGITSGVIYPPALARLSERYRFRSLGGASAGAIGAALGAAAEYDRAGDGFAQLREITGSLGDGGLRALFQPQRETRRLMRVLVAITGFTRGGTKREGVAQGLAVAGAVIRAYAPWLLTGLIAAAVLGVLGWWASGAAAPGGIAGAVLGALIGLIIAVVLTVMRVSHDLTRAVPANSFGICTGLSAGGGDGFTDWLAKSINRCAGLPEDGRPLTFGDLWRGPEAAGAELSPKAAEQLSVRAEQDPSKRAIDLRMITTCLSHGTPYELPFGGRNFFYSIAEWETLFPKSVMDALLEAPTAQPGDDVSARKAAAMDAAAADHGLRRLPVPADLPVIVATRMSLSFTLLISAVPLYEADFRASRGRVFVFHRLWFTDGGLCSNFPLHLFDKALPTRRSFAINLDRLGEGERSSEDEADNVDLPRDNRGRLPRYSTIRPKGWNAVKDFASLSFATAHTWQDNSYLRVPGYRDRIAKVFQSSQEGGLNLAMDGETITRLGKRGKAAADKLIDQFEGPHYPNDRTGWDNHRWIRYRALVAALGPFAKSYRAGRRELDLLPETYPSYSVQEDLLERMDAVDAALAALHDAYEPADVANRLITSAPKPLTRLRRTSGMP